MRSNIREIESAQAALRETPPAVQLAMRYLSKALESQRCMYCHGTLDESEKPYRPHFKGYVHLECAEKYDGRSDYIRRNPEDGAEFPYADERG